MNIDTVTIGMSVGTLCGLLIAVVRFSMALGEMRTKVDTMWAYQMRRAMSEVVQSGIGKMESPISFDESTRAHLSPIRDRLRAWWNNNGKDDNDASSLLEIERIFGDELLKLVCVPCRLSHGACLLLALAVAKDTGKLEVTL